jgi:hypothetical protein
MIALYGRTYAASEKEAVASLFNAGGTVNGFYRKAAAGVYLLDLQGNERAFIRKDGLGPVSVGKHEGKRFYMHSTSSLDDRWLGTPESYSATRDGATQLAASIYARAPA